MWVKNISGFHAIFRIRGRIHTSLENEMLGNYCRWGLLLPFCLWDSVWSKESLKGSLTEFNGKTCLPRLRLMATFMEIWKHGQGEWVCTSPPPMASHNHHAHIPRYVMWQNEYMVRRISTSCSMWLGTFAGVFWSCHLCMWASFFHSCSIPICHIVD